MFRPQAEPRPRSRATAHPADPPGGVVAGGRCTPALLTSAPRAVPTGRAGGLEVRLAQSPREVRRAQRLRYRVFYEEKAAVASASTRLSRRDADAYDAICDHLLVLDHDVPARPFRAHRPKVVGTCRLLRQGPAERHGGFYSAGEFDIAALVAAHPGGRLLELGRSCVLNSHRGRKTVALLLQGLWAYVQAHDVEAMIGCASLEGTDAVRLAVPLAFLHHYARSPEAWRVRAHAHLYVETDRLPAAAIDTRAALKSLPPLIKAYLRVGATFGDGAVVDRQFGTTDVFVVMPIHQIARRYTEHFGTTHSHPA